MTKSNLPNTYGVVANNGVNNNNTFCFETNSVNLFMQPIDYKEYIEVNPEIRFGKPVIKGTRITVYDVLQWLASGLSHEEIIADFPQLTEQQILACLAYAANKERVIKVA